MHDELYRHHILDHYRNPRQFGILKKYTHEAGHRNISCGDAVQFRALVKNGRIIDCAFTGSGCAISIAGASLIAEHAKGKTLTALKAMNRATIEKLLNTQLSSARITCATLGLETLKKLQRASSGKR